MSEKEPVKKKVRYIRFSMRVPETLHESFRKACGLAPMTKVNKKLWLEYIARQARREDE